MRSPLLSSGSAGLRLDAEKARQLRSRVAQRLNIPNVRLASSLAAALLDSLFEHPARLSLSVPAMQVIEALLFRNGFFSVC